MLYILINDNSNNDYDLIGHFIKALCDLQYLHIKLHLHNKISSYKLLNTKKTKVNIR